MIIHIDERNAKDTPCVAIMIGAFDGFKICFPTIGVECGAHSGTMIIGSFAELLHTVACGSGIRLTAVFCQHEDLVTGIKRKKNGDITYVLTGARRSKLDTLRETISMHTDPNDITAVIKCLSDYDFV